MFRSFVDFNSHPEGYDPVAFPMCYRNRQHRAEILLCMVSKWMREIALQTRTTGGETISLAIARAEENGDCSSKRSWRVGFGQFGRYGTSERMSEVGKTRAIESERGHQVIVCCLRVELRVRVGGRAAK